VVRVGGALVETHTLIVVQLALSTGMVILTVIMHLFGLGFLMFLMRLQHERYNVKNSALDDIVAIIIAAVGITVLHVSEMYVYAWMYRAIGAFQDFETAFYYSTVAYTTLGFGDVLLTSQWRIVGAIEAANGLVLIGWSTAFFMSMIAQMRNLEGKMFRGFSGPPPHHDQDDRAKDRPPSRTPERPS
jgi:voltage-gated potassium channel